jgi:Glycosyl hydrolase family 26
LKGKGYSMIWSVNMLPGTYSPNADAAQSGGSCFGLTQGARGDFDHYFRTVAANIVRAGFPVSVIRFGWEFNGNWFPWAAQGCASAYVKYFDNIVTTMRAVPGTHFTFEWNPTRGDLGVGNLAQYYPGNNDVDDIGLDVYDLEQQRYPGAKAEFKYMTTQRYGLNWWRSPSPTTRPSCSPSGAWAGERAAPAASRSRHRANRSAGVTMVHGSTSWPPGSPHTRSWRRPTGTSAPQPCAKGRTR